jgi:uncharacterized RDD family membrane protein YckC
MAAPLADWGTRALGFIIDWLPIAILNAVLYRVTFINALAGLIGLAYWLYLGHMEGVTGQTPGKAIMGLRLVNDKGELIGSGPGIGRKVAHVVDSLVCLLGWLLPLVDSKRQTIADKLLQSYVVTGSEKKQFAVDLWMPPQQSTAG